jgi:hypothetical protein
VHKLDCVTSPAKTLKPKTNPDLVVIIGSGASVPCGIYSTDELTQMAFGAVGSSILTTTLATPDPEGRAMVLHQSMAAGDMFRHALRSVYDDVDFELLLHCVETLDPFTLCSKYPVADFVRPLMTAFAELEADSPPLRTQTTSRRCGTALSRRSTSMSGKIARPCSQLSQMRLQPGTLAAFFAKCTEHFRLVVVNLNYDDPLDRVENIAWNDGFNITGNRGDYRVFDARGWLDALASAEHLLMHLHGSVRFSYATATEDRTRIGFGEPAKYDDPKVASAKSDGFSARRAKHRP